MDPSNLFTVEDTRPDGSMLVPMPFLDTLVITQEDGTLTGVYRKHTHTNFSTVGQPWQPGLQIQCDQHPHTQGQSSVLHPSTAERRTTTSGRGPDKMQIS